MWTKEFFTVFDDSMIRICLKMILQKSQNFTLTRAVSRVIASFSSGTGSLAIRSSDWAVQATVDFENRTNKNNNNNIQNMLRLFETHESSAWLWPLHSLSQARPEESPHFSSLLTIPIDTALSHLYPCTVRITRLEYIPRSAFIVHKELVYFTVYGKFWIKKRICVSTFSHNWLWITEDYWEKNSKIEEFPKIRVLIRVHKTHTIIIATTRPILHNLFTQSFHRSH